MTIIERLEVRQKYHHDRAAALQVAIEELQDGAATQAKASLNGRLADAITLRKATQQDRRRAERSRRTAQLRPSRLRSIEEREHKARIVAQILKDAGKPLPSKELCALAREQGVKAMTGIHNYVKAGYIRSLGTKKKNRRYAFKAMPPAAESAEAQ